MEFVSRYVSHQPDAQGRLTIQTKSIVSGKSLFERQMKIIPGRACKEFCQGIKDLG